MPSKYFFALKILLAIMSNFVISEIVAKKKVNMSL